MVAAAPAGCARNRSAAADTPATEPARDEDAVARAQQLRAQGFREQALAELEAAIARNPKLTVAYIGVADIYRESGDYEPAARHYAQAAALEPRNFDAQYGHGLMLHYLNRLSEAVRAYLRALAVRPDDFDANLNLATAYLQLAEPEQAVAFAERAVRIRGDSPNARVNLGAVYAALNRHDEAVAQYQQAAEYMELTPELLLNLADSLGKAGRFAEMVNTLERLVDVQPSAAAYERMGTARFRLRQYDDALSAFRAALELDADYYPAHNGVGVCLLNRYIWSNRTDRTALDEALAALRRSLQIEPRQERIIELIARYG